MLPSHTTLNTHTITSHHPSRLYYPIIPITQIPPFPHPYQTSNLLNLLNPNTQAHSLTNRLTLFLHHLANNW